jgi:antitoxin ParD1/3/4
MPSDKRVSVAAQRKRDSDTLLPRAEAAGFPYYGYNVVMTIHINLSPEMESYIKAKVSSGFYGSATEVIRDAIRRMQAEDERIAAFRRAVAEGEAELDRGEGIAYNQETLEAITREALDDSAEPIDPDVCPRSQALPKGAQRLRRRSPLHPGGNGDRSKCRSTAR